MTLQDRALKAYKEHQAEQVEKEKQAREREITACWQKLCKVLELDVFEALAPIEPKPVAGFTVMFEVDELLFGCQHGRKGVAVYVLPQGNLPVRHDGNGGTIPDLSSWELERLQVTSLASLGRILLREANSDAG